MIREQYQVKYILNGDEKIDRVYQRCKEACDKICEEEGVMFGIKMCSLDMDFGCHLNRATCNGTFEIWREWVE